MTNYMKRWEEVYTAFEERYPHLSNKIVDWAPCCRNEIILRTDKGDKLIFNFIGSDIRILKRAEDMGEYREEIWRTEFAVRLSNMMSMRGIPRWELARMTGISEVSISKYTNGKATPSAYLVSKLAKALECSETELISFWYLWED